MPFKHNSAPRHQIRKGRYRVQNWPASEAGLKRRGDLTLWLDKDAFTGWQAPRRSTPGGQAQYSDAAIELVLMLRLVFHLSLRQAEGFATSLLQLLGLALRIPDHTRHRNSQYVNSAGLGQLFHLAGALARNADLGEGGGGLVRGADMTGLIASAMVLAPRDLTPLPRRLQLRADPRAGQRRRRLTPLADCAACEGGVVPTHPNPVAACADRALLRLLSDLEQSRPSRVAGVQGRIRPVSLDGSALTPLEQDEPPIWRMCGGRERQQQQAQ
jgi:hypothetical protein